MPKLSHLAENLIGSEILKINQIITKKSQEGMKIHNLTIGDFDPHEFSIPSALSGYIKDSYDANQTNYPPADGVPQLKASLAALIENQQGIVLQSDEIMVAGGGRPLIYAIFKAIVDPGDTVVYPVPSWNNNHYCFLTQANGIALECTPQQGFLPSKSDIEPHIESAVLLTLCSPSNPSGTMFGYQQLKEIVDLVVEENQRREPLNQKPLYVMYDQIYSALHSSETTHYDPISINPAIRPYVVYVDGISKSLAATGLRLGWAYGAAEIISKMKAILGHIGAWAPKPEQVACATFFGDQSQYQASFDIMNQKLKERLSSLYWNIMNLRVLGLPIDAIEPQGAIYLSVRFPIFGMTAKNGKQIKSTDDISTFLLDEAAIGAIPFTAFGCAPGTDWFRLSVGTLQLDEIPRMIATLRTALTDLR